MAGDFPERHGARWTDLEIEALRRQLKSGVSAFNIAKKHKRSEYAILCAIDKLNQQTVVDEIQHRDDIIINGKNYSILLNRVKTIVNAKVNIVAAVGGLV